VFIVKSIEEIDSKSFEEFSCGNEDLDLYLKEFARQNHRKGIGKTFIALDGDCSIGYYTISMASIEFKDLPEGFNRGVPKYPIPVAKIGRLAIDKKFQGKKIGSGLLIDALKKIQGASKIVAAYAVVVDAKNEKAKKFYESFGFITFKNELSLLLSMKTINELLKS
jgi:ribosomal protein S18 acetylase RimI-like enzyme